MARAPRPQIEGGVYHVTIRGVRRLPIFHDDEDRRGMLMILEDVAERYGWIVHAYVLMGNHWHLVITTPRANISAGMQRLNHTYARHFNLRHGFAGHAFDRRFFSRLVRSDGQLLTLMRYLALNPVLAGLARRPQHYLWSSFPALFGEARTPGFLSSRWLSLLAPTAGAARSAFAELVADEHAVGRPPP